MTDKIVVLSTCATPNEGEKIARKLVEERLAACVNIVQAARSVYLWKGEIEEAAECLLIIKSSRERFDRLRVELGRAHSYEVPEALALPVLDGAPNYLNWMEEVLGTKG